MVTAHPAVSDPAQRAPAAAVAMPPLDAWLHRHQSVGGLCMTVGLLASFDGPPPTLAALRDRVRRRWARFARLRLVPGSWQAGWPGWTVAPAFDVDTHVTVAAGGGSVVALAARLLPQPFGAEVPPWRLLLVPSSGDGFALLLCGHHALLDGVSLSTLVRSLLDAPPGADPVPPRPAPGGPPSGRLSHLRALGDLLPRARPLPFHGPVDDRRAVGCALLSPAELAAARAALPPDTPLSPGSVPPRGPSLPSGSGLPLPAGASRNAVFLSAVAGALGAAGVAGPGLCAMVPVDVRGAGERDVLGNRYATVRVPLPRDADPVRRLGKVEARTRRAELTRRAAAQARLVSSRPRRYGRLAALLGRYADSPRYSSLLCSSVALPGAPLHLGAARLAHAALLPPLSPGHPLLLTMTSHGEAAVLTAVTDHAHRHLATQLPDLVHREIRALGR
jgi:hypothetical protein